MTRRAYDVLSVRSRAGGNRLTNHKYTLRVWMLVGAYSKADPGGDDYSRVHKLFGLIKDPYAEGHSGRS